MNAATSPFARPIARLLAHKRALGLGYVREARFLAEIERLTVGWPDAVLSEGVARTYLTGRTDGARPNRLTVMRALAIFLSLETRGLSSHRHDSSASGGVARLSASSRARRRVGFCLPVTRCPTPRRFLGACSAAPRYACSFSPVSDEENWWPSRTTTWISKSTW
jgi:hypothetical protein